MKTALLTILFFTVTLISNGQDSFSSTERVDDIRISRFQGDLNNNKVCLQWTIVENERVNQFEVERSYDGAKFNTAGLVFASEKPGSEDYLFPQLMNSEKVYYRIKMIDKTGRSVYSDILVFSKDLSRNFDIKVLTNPVGEVLTLGFESDKPATSTITVKDINGREILAKKITNSKGYNVVSIQLPSMQSGIYVVKIFDGAVSNSIKFIKL